MVADWRKIWVMGVAVLIQEVKVGLFEEACIWYLSQPLKAVRELE